MAAGRVPYCMARRSTKKIIDKITDKRLRDKFYGDEPSLSMPMADLLNWYSNVCDDDQAKDWLKEYLVSCGRNDELLMLERVHGDWIPRTAAWLARLSLRGYPMTAKYFATIKTQLQRAYEHQIVQATNAVKPNVQTNIRNYASKIVAEVEGMIDTGTIKPGWDFKKWLWAHDVSAPVASKIVERFTPRAMELIEATNTDDDQLIEAYSRYTTEEVIDMAVIYQTLVDDCAAYLEKKQ
jgi:hypothetical protein